MGVSLHGSHQQILQVEHDGDGGFHFLARLLDSGEDLLQGLTVNVVLAYPDNICAIGYHFLNALYVHRGLSKGADYLRRPVLASLLCGALCEDLISEHFDDFFRIRQRGPGFCLLLITFFGLCPELRGSKLHALVWKIGHLENLGGVLMRCPGSLLKWIFKLGARLLRGVLSFGFRATTVRFWSRVLASTRVVPPDGLSCCVIKGISLPAHLRQLQCLVLLLLLLSDLLLHLHSLNFN